MANEDGNDTIKTAIARSKSSVQYNTVPANAMTTGTYTPNHCSKRCNTSGFVFWASSISSTIRPNADSFPNWVISINNSPWIFSVPAKISAPTCTVCNLDSPVITAALIFDVPLTTTPSTGINSPARTTTVCPTFKDDISTHDSEPLVESTNRARFTCRALILSIAVLTPNAVRSSKSRPISRANGTKVAVTKSPYAQAANTAIANS